MAVESHSEKKNQGRYRLLHGDLVILEYEVTDKDNEEWRTVKNCHHTVPFVVRFRALQILNSLLGLLN